jgi:4-hydroxy-tetrahydrodipicolinate reductase
MKIAIIGYGKMGKTIERVARERGHEIALIIDQDNKDDLDRLSEADVAIEFTRPESALTNLLSCLQHGVPVVCGTTGWLDHWEAVSARFTAEDGALLYASNYSIGVNIFFEINRRLAELMAAQPQYEVRLEEIHHTQKLDAPSGTGITLANDILKALPRKSHWVNRPAQTADELPIISKREDPAPGTHTIEYVSPIDSILIRHTAHSREGFASGAVLAAEWLLGKRGVFGMRDVLGI